MKMTERYAHSDIESLRADIERISLNGKRLLVKGKKPVDMLERRTRREWRELQDVCLLRV